MRPLLVITVITPRVTITFQQLSIMYVLVRMRRIARFISFNFRLSGPRTLNLLTKFSHHEKEMKNKETGIDHTSWLYRPCRVFTRVHANKTEDWPTIAKISSIIIGTFLLFSEPESKSFITDGIKAAPNIRTRPRTESTEGSTKNANILSPTL